MSAARCLHEDALLEALGRGFVGAELESHIATCASCAELHLVAATFLDERRTAISEAPVPSSGTMWWRMRVRERQEAEARARQSLLIGQAVTLMVAIGLVISFFGTDLAVSVRQLATTLRLSTPILLALATWIVAAPIAGWVAIRQK